MKINDEMQALKSLRAKLEEGIRQNDSLRAQLHDKLASAKIASPLAASPYDAAYQREIQELKSRLDDSERWNASLQARLNELQSRHSGVGRDNVDTRSSSLSNVQKLEQVRNACVVRVCFIMNSRKAYVVILSLLLCADVGQAITVIISVAAAFWVSRPKKF